MRMQKVSILGVVILILLMAALLAMLASSAPATSAPPAQTTSAPTSSAPAPTTQPPAAAKTLRIGYLLCISGWYSIFDAVEEGDVKIVAQIINDQGGLTIQGQKYNIQLVGEDGKSSLDGCTAAANKLV